MMMLVGCTRRKCKLYLLKLNIAVCSAHVATNDVLICYSNGVYQSGLKLM